MLDKISARWATLDVPTKKMFHAELMSGEEILNMTDMHDNHLDPVDIAKVYLVIFHKSVVIDIISEKIRPYGDEFCRDISTLPDLLERLYLIGYWDGMGKSLSISQTKGSLNAVKKRRVKA